MVKAYKGFNKDMTCRDYQFAEGETYTEERAKLCKSGFHACRNPLDCLRYYNPASSVYHEVELDDVSNECSSDDSKIVGRRIKIGSRLDVADLCRAHFEYTSVRCTPVDGNVANDGERCSGGDYSSLAGGDYSSLAGGHYSSLAGGDYSSLAGGDYSSLAGGNRSSLAGGNRSSLAGGDYSSLAGGHRSSLAGGNRSSLAGFGSAAGGNDCIIALRGNGCRVKGGLGSLLVIAEEEPYSSKIAAWKALVVDGVDIKEDTWYQLRGGELVPCEDQEG